MRYGRSPAQARGPFKSSGLNAPSNIMGVYTGNVYMMDGELMQPGRRLILLHAMDTHVENWVPQEEGLTSMREWQFN